jgi:hypothetical protein
MWLLRPKPSSWAMRKPAISMQGATSAHCEYCGLSAMLGATHYFPYSDMHGQTCEGRRLLTYFVTVLPKLGLS